MSTPRDTGPDAGWRPMVLDDRAAIMTVAARVHPTLPEGAAVFAERLALCPAGCLTLVAGAHVRGYAMAFPWVGPAPALDTAIGQLPHRPDHLYIHDVAILPDARGSGAGSRAAAAFAAFAATLGLAELRLVAIAGATGFWLRHGYVPTGAVAGYGEGATAMTLTLPG